MMQNVCACRRYRCDHLTAHLREQPRITVEQIRISRDRHAGKTQHKVAVNHRILQLGALTFYFFRHRFTADCRQGRYKTIHSIQPHQAIEAIIRHAGAFFKQIGRIEQRVTQHQRGDRFAHRSDFRHRSPASRERTGRLIAQMSVQRVADIG